YAVAPGMKLAHDEHGETGGDVGFYFRIGARDAQVERVAATDHFFQYLADTVMVFRGPPGDDVDDLRFVAPNIVRRRLVGLVFFGVGKQARQIDVEELRPVLAVTLLFFHVILPQRHLERTQRQYFAAVAQPRRLRADFFHQPVDIFELLERGPAAIALAPVGVRLEPHRERLRPVLVRMRLRVPVAEVQHEALAVGSRHVGVGVARARAAEVALPVAPPVQLIGVQERVPGFVAQQLHALGGRAALDFEHELAFKALQPRVGEKKRNGDAGYAVGAEPFIRKPEVRAEIEAALLELGVETARAMGELGALDAQRQVADPHVEQTVVRPCRPRARDAARAPRGGTARRASLSGAAFARHASAFPRLRIAR